LAEVKRVDFQKGIGLSTLDADVRLVGLGGGFVPFERA
jgi:hypothetical protein